MSAVPRDDVSDKASDDASDESARRARVRRFGLRLLAGVAAVVLFAVGYVVLFDHVLVDPNRPPTATALNPRVLMFELLLAVAVAVVVTALVVRSRRSKP